MLFSDEFSSLQIEDPGFLHHAYIELPFHADDEDYEDLPDGTYIIDESGFIRIHGEVDETVSGCWNYDEEYVQELISRRLSWDTDIWSVRHCQSYINPSQPQTSLGYSEPYLYWGWEEDVWARRHDRSLINPPPPSPPTTPTSPVRTDEFIYLEWSSDIWSRRHSSSFTNPPPPSSPSASP